MNRALILMSTLAFTPAHAATSMKPMPVPQTATPAQAGKMLPDGMLRDFQCNYLSAMLTATNSKRNEEDSVKMLEDYIAHCTAETPISMAPTR